MSENYTLIENVLERSGWGWPADSRKAHYFEDGISLCRRWMFMGKLTPNQDGTSPDDCAVCRKKLNAKTDSTAKKSSTG